MPSGSNSDVSAGAAARAEARLDAAITDLFLPDDARLDDRTRVALRQALARLVGTIEGDIRRHAARLLAGRGAADAADALLSEEGTALARLTDAGLLRDPPLIEQIVACTRAASIEGSLPTAVAEPNRPSLLVRLADLADGVVAGAARAMLAAESREDGPLLPAELQHRLAWRVAAAVRVDRADAGDAIAEATRRHLAAHDEGELVAAVAIRLIAAIDPLAGEVPALIVEALGDRRLSLVVALLARGLSLDADTARALIVEPDDERLWIALRALGMARDDIARVALALADADPRRDIEGFADRLDDIAALDPAAARATLAPLSLPRDLRLAARALATGRR